MNSARTCHLLCANSAARCVMFQIVDRNNHLPSFYKVHCRQDLSFACVLVTSFLKFKTGLGERNSDNIKSLVIYFG